MDMQEKCISSVKGWSVWLSTAIEICIISEGADIPHMDIISRFYKGLALNLLPAIKFFIEFLKF